MEHAASVEPVRTLNRAVRVIALSAEAMNALDAADVPYRTPEDYVASSALNAAGIATYDTVASYCRTLDAWLGERLPASAPIAPAMASFYEIKILHDTLMLRAMEVDAILAAERPDRVFAARAVSDEGGGTMAFDIESAYSRVLETRSVPVEWSARPSAPAVPLKQQRTLKSMVPAEWRQRLSLFRSTGFKGMGQSTAGDAVLLLNITPDIRYAMQSPASDGVRFVHWQGSGQPMTVRPLRMRGDARINLTAQSAGPSDAPPAGLVDGRLEVLARPRIARFVARDVPQMVAAAGDARQVVDHYRPVSAVAGIIAGPRARGAAAGVRLSGVPLTLCQHGGSYGYIDHPIHYFNDLAQADRFVTYGEGVTADLRARYGSRRPVADMTSAGSAALSRTPHAGARATHKKALGLDERPLVLYVGTCLMGQRFYAPHYRSCEYFALLSDAARVLGSLTGAQVILKTHQRGDNAFNPIAEWCRRDAPSVRVVSSGGLEPWLRAADAVAMDLPGTPLLEALAHAVPVLAYMPPQTFELSARGGALLRAAVTLETSREAFLSKLAGLPASAAFREAGPFMSAYATSGSAADALARALVPAGARA